MIVSSLIRALPQLADVVILAAFFFSIFGIACTELFMGQFYGRCGIPDFSNAFNIMGDDTLILGVSSSLIPSDSSIIHLCIIVNAR